MDRKMKCHLRLVLSQCKLFSACVCVCLFGETLELPEKKAFIGLEVVCLAISCLLLLLSFPLQCILVIRSATRCSWATTFWGSIRTTRMFSEGDSWQVRSGGGPQSDTWQVPEWSSFVFTWIITEYRRQVRKSSMHGQERCPSLLLCLVLATHWP